MSTRQKMGHRSVSTLLSLIADTYKDDTLEACKG